MRRMRDDLQAAMKRTVTANSFSVDDLVTGVITALTGEDLELQGVTGKDIVLKLTDASGARSVKVLDSADATVASIDSDGNIIATKITAKVPYAESATGGVPSAATLIAAFGAAATVGAGFKAQYKDTTASTGVLYDVGCDGTNYWVTAKTKAV